MYYYQILVKSPGLKVVSGPRDVLRDKKGRLMRQNMGFQFNQGAMM